MSISSSLGLFPVGSPISRAAARALIEKRRAQSALRDLVLRVEGLDAPCFSDWEESGNGSFTRRSKIPSGMTFEDAEIAAGLAPVRTDGDYMRLITDDRIRTVPSRRDLKPSW